MATGDDALAAGMTILNGNELANTLDTEENKTRDYIAQFFDAAKTFASALIPAIWPVSKGGTGRSNVFASTAPSSSAAPVVVGADGQLYRMSGTFQPAVIPPVTVDLSSRVAKTGDTMSGELFLPNSSAAVSAYTIAYINGDGRVSRGASSERYKKFISTIDPDSLGDIWPDLSRFQMRTGDGAWKYGYIAERLAEHPDQQPFVVYADRNGELVPDSIDFIALLMAQNAQLRGEVTNLRLWRIEAEERLKALETR